MKDEQQPAGYDSEGRPLYYRDPQQVEKPAAPTSLVTVKPDEYAGHDFNPKIRAQYANEPDLVHASRSLEPKVPEISEELRHKHDESVKRYPYLNLSEGEFVVLQIKRHPIGLLIPIIAMIFSTAVLVALAFLVPDFYDTMVPSTSALRPAESLVIIILIFLTLISLGFGAVSIWVYQRNQFFLTNESVIQEVQYSLFSRREQTVSLGSIEDASFRRQGILQHIFNYGTMRLSTEGQETTYLFAYVEDPKVQIATVNNAVEAFKNGRPVVGDD